MVRVPQSGTEVIYYRIMNSKKDGTLKKYSILKMCGARWNNMELGVFVHGEIKYNVGYSLERPFHKPRDTKSWGIFWWHKR